jgi:zinc transporter ZupT
MKPAYWIGILALVGAIVGYAISQLTGWLGWVTGSVAGFIIGLALYARQTRTTG